MITKDDGSARRRTRGDRSESARHVGDRIKAAADAIGSRKEAARLAGVSDDMLYRYMRGETPPRFDAIVGLAQAAGFSLDWMATGHEAPAVREGGAAYDLHRQEGWARDRLQEVEALLARESQRPVASERVESEEALRAALEDLRRIARLGAVPQELRTAAARLGSTAFADAGLAQVLETVARELPRSAERLAEVADELEDAIREAGYRPPELIVDGFKTAMYVNDMPRAAAVTLLQFLEAQERKQRR